MTPRVVGDDGAIDSPKAIDDEGDQHPIEQLARTACRRGDFEAAARAAIDGYGREIHSFLVSHLQGQLAQAEDVFSDFSEDFWRSLPHFQWRCSLRAWCYKLARGAASRHRRRPHNRPDLRLGLRSSYEQEGAPIRSETQPYLRSEVKDEFRTLRERLSIEDQDLLTLRIDRNLSWRDVAHAMDANHETLEDDQLSRSEARLRQRFQDVKKRLRHLAKEAGLL